jgi:putative flippase GtrA
MKYKAVFWYLVFGALSTVINVASYWFCYVLCGFSNTFSNVVAWFFAVIFAFVTNKLYVFESRELDRKVLFHEVASFFLCRTATGLLDISIMYISVDLLTLNSMIMKIISNVVVII